MPPDIRIVSVEQDGADGLVVTFSDGTTAAYVVEELLELRPFRRTLSKDNDGLDYDFIFLTTDK